MKIRIRGTIDASFEWVSNDDDETRAQAMYGKPIADIAQLSATELRILIGGGRADAPQPNDRTYDELTGSPLPEDASEGANLLWLARKSRGQVVYG